MVVEYLDMKCLKNYNLKPNSMYNKLNWRNHDF